MPHITGMNGMGISIGKVCVAYIQQYQFTVYIAITTPLTRAQTYTALQAAVSSNQSTSFIFTQ
jgi:hypothetical protein